MPIRHVHALVACVALIFAACDVTAPEDQDVTPDPLPEESECDVPDLPAGSSAFRLWNDSDVPVDSVTLYLSGHRKRKQVRIPGADAGARSCYEVVKLAFRQSGQNYAFNEMYVGPYKDHWRYWGDRQAIPVVSAYYTYRLRLRPTPLRFVVFPDVTHVSSEDTVKVRVLNTEPVAFDNVTMIVPGKTIDFGRVLAGKASGYHTAPNGAYRHDWIQVVIGRDTIRHEPTDHVGESRTHTGLVTYHVDTVRTTVLHDEGTLIRDFPEMAN